MEIQLPRRGVQPDESPAVRRAEHEHYQRHLRAVAQRSAELPQDRADFRKNSVLRWACRTGVPCSGATATPNRALLEVEDLLANRLGQAGKFRRGEQLCDLRLQSHLRKSIPQRVPRQTQQPCRLTLIAVRTSERLPDDLLLVLVERHPVRQER